MKRLFATRPRRIACTAIATLILGLAALSVALAASTPPELEVPGGAWRIVDRALTGHQRAERVVFFDQGKKLAVTCPRYGHLVLYDVAEGLSRVCDKKLRGKPMAVREFEGVLWVLQRPIGDSRHLEPAFWQRIDFQGNDVGAPFPVGYDPDDFVIVPEKRLAIVLLSGNSEGETNRPPASLMLFDITNPDEPRPHSEIPLSLADDDPTGLIVSRRASHLGVQTYRGVLVGFDLSAPAQPRETGRIALADRDQPWFSHHEGDTLLVPDQTGGPAVSVASRDPNSIDQISSVALPTGTVRFRSAVSGAPLGELPLRGPFGLGQELATGLAADPQAGTIAVCDRTGGVHLVRFVPR